MKTLLATIAFLLFGCAGCTGDTLRPDALLCEAEADLLLATSINNVVSGTALLADVKHLAQLQRDSGALNNTARELTLELRMLGLSANDEPYSEAKNKIEYAEYREAALVRYAEAAMSQHVVNTCDGTEKLLSVTVLENKPGSVKVRLEDGGVAWTRVADLRK